jgi:hypothetical protein
MFIKNNTFAIKYRSPHKLPLNRQCIKRGLQRRKDCFENNVKTRSRTIGFRFRMPESGNIKISDFLIFNNNGERLFFRRALNKTLRQNIFNVVKKTS